MKSVYVDDVLHHKLKKLALENQQTLISLLNRLVREGVKRIEKRRKRPRETSRDPVGMFGLDSARGGKEVDVENAYGQGRYQGVEDHDGRF